MEEDMVIYPTCMMTRLRITQKPRGKAKVRGVLLRWMQRAAQRKGRFINEPSLKFEGEYDVALRQQYILVWVDTVPDTSPGFLRTTDVPA